MLGGILSGLSSSPPAPLRLSDLGAAVPVPLVQQFGYVASVFGRPT